MENIVQLTPLQVFLALVFNVWMFVIFPVLVIKKLNYMTALLESQFEQGEEEEN
ncbi:MAG: hypothetical protein KAR05_06395 [Candidatus Omnitrophica bacterium]|nr:hypothetical protein [Candidatus Omnitrophota bacterium]